jgi:LysM repeat protein
MLIVAILFAAWLLPQLQSNMPSQIAPTPTALAQNAAKSTATLAPTAAAADLPGTPIGAEAAAPSGPPAASPTSEQSAATVQEIPATATSAPATAVAQAPSAPSPTQAAEADQQGSTTYTVKAGDSLSVISKRYGTTTKAIMDANNLQSTLIRVGQVLTIPPPSTPTP